MPHGLSLTRGIHSKMIFSEIFEGNCVLVKKTHMEELYFNICPNIIDGMN